MACGYRLVLFALASLVLTGSGAHAAAPERVVVLAPDGGDIGALASSLARDLEQETSVTLAPPRDLPLHIRGGRRALLIVPPDALSDGATPDALNWALEHGSVVLVVADSRDGVQPPGFVARPAPRGTTCVWSPLPEFPVGAEPVSGPMAVAATNEALRGGRADPLLLMGRLHGEADGIAAFSIRYYEGPRAGSALVVLGGEEAGRVLLHRGVGSVEALLGKLDSPYLAAALPDYALVYPDEAVRLPVTAVCRSSDERRFVVGAQVTSSGGAVLGRDTAAPAADEPFGGGIIRLSAVLRLEPRRWPGARLLVRTTLRADAALLDTRQALIAVAGGTAPRTGLDVTVTSRRLAISGRTAPFVTVEGRQPWEAGALPAGENDLAAWWAELQALAGASAQSIRFPSEANAGEWGLRLDEARAMLAAGLGLMPEVALPAGSDHVPSTPVLVVSPDTPRPVETLSAPRGTPVPAPLPLPEGARLVPLAVERAVHAASQPVRLLSGTGLNRGLNRDLVLSAFLLGCAGIVVSADPPGPPPATGAEMLRANMLAALLQPAAHIPDVPVLGALEDDAVLPALLNGAPVDWGSVSSLTESDLTPVAQVALTGSATPFAGADGPGLLTWVREGGRLLAPEAAIASLPPGSRATPEAFGVTAPVGKGWLAGLRQSAGAALDQALGWARLRPAGDRSPAAARFIRTPLNGSGDIVAAFARDGAAGRVALLVSGHRVELGVRPGDPAWAAGDGVGIWAVSGCGDITIDGRQLLSAPDDCAVTLVSLRRSPLEAGPDYLLFCEPATECDLRLDLGAGAPSLLVWRGRPLDGQMREIAHRATRVQAGAQYIRVTPRDSGLLLIAAPRETVPRAVERVERLVYG